MTAELRHDPESVRAGSKDVIVQDSKDNIAVRQENPNSGETKSVQRGHGGALPR
jgi:hypothetical protein